MSSCKAALFRRQCSICSVQLPFCQALFAAPPVDLLPAAGVEQVFVETRQHGEQSQSSPTRLKLAPSPHVTNVKAVVRMGAATFAVISASSSAAAAQ